METPRVLLTLLALFLWIVAGLVLGTLFPGRELDNKLATASWIVMAGFLSALLAIAWRPK